MGDERTVSLDLFMHQRESAPVAINGEPRDGPQDLPEEVGHRTHVEEDRSKGLLTQIDDLEPSFLCPLDRSLPAPSVGHRLWSHHELSELTVGSTADLL